MAKQRRDLRSRLSGSTEIAIAMAVMNLATYLYTMLAARFLGPRPYGAFASLMATLLVFGVVQLGLQATAARRVAAQPERAGAIQDAVMRATHRTAWVFGLLVLAAAPLLDRVLRLGSLPTAALVAVTVVPMTIMGGQAGVLQGERRWRPLALVYLASGVPRLVIGTALIWWEGTEFAAILGVALGALVPVLVGWLALRTRPDDTSGAPAVDGIWREAVYSSQALFAFFALSNIDVMVARNVLSAYEAGLYAGGLILTKAVLFLPQFVVVVAFPAMSSADERRNALVRSLSVVTLLGAASTVGTWLLPDLALAFVGGEQYRGIASHLWWFAVLGTVLSTLQLLVYAVLARQGRWSILLVWLALVALVVGGLLVGQLALLVFVVVFVDAGLLGALALVSLRRIRRAGREDQRPAASEDMAPSADAHRQ